MGSLRAVFSLFGAVVWVGLPACDGGEDPADAGVDVGAEDVRTVDAMVPDAPADDAASSDAASDTQDSSSNVDAGFDSGATRELDELEALFQMHFTPRTTLPGSWEDPASFAVQCLANALVLRRQAEGSRFDPDFVRDVMTAMHASADQLVTMRSSFVGGWGGGTAEDWFNDGTVTPANVATGFDTSQAIWCLSEASRFTDDVERSAEYENAARIGLQDYSAGGYQSPDETQLCATCGYFWYTPHAFERNRYIKNITALMGIAAQVTGEVFDLDEAREVGRASIQSLSREVGASGTGNMYYEGRLDESFPNPAKLFDTHNYLEAYVLLHSGELSHSPAHICRGFRQYQAFLDGTDSPRHVSFASCQFARRDADSLTRCREWIRSECIEAGKHCLQNRGGLGLVADYWPEDTRTAEEMCE